MDLGCNHYWYRVLGEPVCTYCIAEKFNNMSDYCDENHKKGVIWEGEFEVVDKKQVKKHLCKL